MSKIIESPIFIENHMTTRSHTYEDQLEHAFNRLPISPSQVWINFDVLPKQAPPGLIKDGQIFGDVKFHKERPLIFKPGYDNQLVAKFMPKLQQVIPTNLDITYQSTLKDSNGKLIPHDPTVWLLDGLTNSIEFLYGIPEGYKMPFNITYYEYIGPIASGPQVAIGTQLAFKYDLATNSIQQNVGSFGGSIDPASNDFVFGSVNLNNTTNPLHDSRMLFDKSSGAFRVGSVTGNQWDTRPLGSFAAGIETTSSGLCTFVAGQNNTASGDLSLVVGGSNNIATNQNSIILGGSNNNITSDRGVIIGGVNNTLSSASNDSFIGVGSSNSVSSPWSTILHGENNIINQFGGYNVITGGVNMSISDTNTFVTLNGGEGNATTSNTNWGSIGGGKTNKIGRNYATVGGGHLNEALFNASTVSGGEQNFAKNNNSTVSGGGQNQAFGENSVIGGGMGNLTNNTNAVVGGGQSNTSSNVDSTISGGSNNQATGTSSTVCGGNNNIASGNGSTICGGNNNNASGLRSCVLSGDNCSSNGDYSLVGGNGCSSNGNNNSVSGENCSAVGSHNSVSGLLCLSDGSYNSVSGLSCSSSGNYNAVSGDNCIVSGDFNLVSGRQSIVSGSFNMVGGRSVRDNGNSGCFIYSDSTSSIVNANVPNSFNVGASGGSIIYSDTSLSLGVELPSNGTSWSSLSDRNMKENITPLNHLENLAKVESLDIFQYNYKGQDASVLNRGPVAQDWHTLFPSEKDPLRIDTMDLDGITLSALKGLLSVVNSQRVEIDNLKNKIDKLVTLTDKLVTLTDKLNN